MNTETIQTRLKEIKKGSHGLKMCPWCDGPAVVDTIDMQGSASNGFSGSCQAEGTGCIGVIALPNEFYGTYEEAATAWNNRPIEAELIALVESLLKEKGKIRREMKEEALACVQSVMDSGAVSNGRYSAEEGAAMIGGALGQVRLQIDALTEEPT